MVTVQFRVPVPSSELLANILGLLGLLAVVVGAGGLLGNWWVSVVLAGGACVFVSWVAAQAGAQQARPARAASAPVLDDVRAAKRVLVDVENRLRTG